MIILKQTLCIYRSGQKSYEPAEQISYRSMEKWARNLTSRKNHQKISNMLSRDVTDS